MVRRTAVSVRETGYDAPRHQNDLRIAKPRIPSWWVFMNNPSTETTNIWAARVARIDPIGHAFLRYGLVVAIR